MFRDRIMQGRVLGVALAFALVAALPAPAQEPLDASSVDHFEQALTAQKARQFDRAVELYRSVISKIPTFAEAHLNLGIVYQLQSKYKDSIPAFHDALALKPNLEAAQVLLGISYYMLQDFTSARQSLELVLARDPKERQAGVYLALTLLGLNQPEAAAHQLRRTAQFFPDNIEISYYLGVAYSDGVKESARLLLEGSRESALYEWAMAISAEKKNDIDSAIIGCLKALAIDPNISQLYSLLASLFTKAGFPDLARDAESRLHTPPSLEGLAGSTSPNPERRKDYLDLWAKLGSIHPDPGLPLVADTELNKLVQQAMAADRSGKLGAAVDLYRKGEFGAAKRLLTPGPKEAQPWISAYVLARCELGDRDFDGAEQVLETSLKGRLQLPTVALLKVQVQSELALRAYESVVAREPDSNAARLLQAKAFAAANNPDKAIEVYKDALRLQPGLPEIHLAIAKLEADRLNWSDVIDEIHEELAVSPENSLALALLAHAYAETDQGKEAIPLLIKVLANYPDDVDGLSDLGKSYAQQGNRAKAIDAYERALAIDGSRYRLHYRLFQLYQAGGQVDLAQQHLKVFQAEDSSRRAKATVIRSDNP
jgi:tetratricopeptide (TPR) repeat protein